ncbi:MAG: peptidoglycan-binding protein, partial [Clostridia bacterium]|nr:peptidoglycan-binding protein [Clostridia bacterium]
MKHYLIGVLLTVLLITFIFIPVGAEGEKDTGIDGSANPVLYKINDNSIEVVNIQSRLRDLGYYNYKVTGFYGSLTEYAVKLFQRYNGIKETGKVDSVTEEALYANEAKRLPMSAIDASADRFGVTPSPTPKPTAKPTAKPTPKATPKPDNSNITSNGKVKTGSYLDWSQVKGIFAKGDIATVYDFNTGVSWRV